MYLEQKGLVHRDLAARNVLLMDSKTVKGVVCVLGMYLYALRTV